MREIPPGFHQKSCKEHQNQCTISDTTLYTWRSNPASVGSRDMPVEDLLSSELRFAGPAFLRDSEEKWPEDTSHLTTTDDDEQEEVSSHQKLRLHTYYCFKKNDSTPGRDFSTL
ncbi:hypothetical protein RB195_010605 [Necator americanus]|uniref:Uncharacterized protein n=1 Tax=Necator americanus TaxID=51031 RepID=A0ABR1D029_NECAM